jgi:hypothetical protein
MTTARSASPDSGPRERFDWAVQPGAEALVDTLIGQVCAASPALGALAADLAEHTSTRLADWLDHIQAPVPTARLEEVGYVEGHRTVAGVWRHPGAQLPAVVPATRRAVALRVDDAAAFASAHASERGVAGSPLSRLRQAVVVEGPVTVAGVERRSWSVGVRPEDFDDVGTLRAGRAWHVLAERPRVRGGAEAVEAAADLARRAVEEVGTDLAASYFLELERRYWQRRNHAAVIQHARQDLFGLGWGNNDHHTFRSSRTCFGGLLGLLRTLGFDLRERFYAGAQAGWGAQVLEHPGNGGVIFADVDLGPEEVDVDFSATPLPERDRLGTVGLWCALHGESVLAAGMHHLEGQFTFDRLREDLAAHGVGHMPPFSDLPHLRQAFTEAQRWPVPEAVLAGLVRRGTLTAEQAGTFARRGAAGSHLENLARRGGFKGFNQANVTTTLRATDPRRYLPVDSPPG